MSWRKRILLDAEVQKQLYQHLPEEYQNRLNEQIFKMRMLLAEFQIHVDTNDVLKKETQEILSPFKTKRNLAGLEMDMDGKLVVTLHHGEPLSPFSRQKHRTYKTNKEKAKKEVVKKEVAKSEEAPKRGFIKTAPAISPVKKIPKGSQFVDEGLRSLFGEDIPAPPTDEPVEKFAPPPKNPPQKVRLRFNDAQTQSNTTVGKIGSGSLENLLQAEMKKIDQRRPWEDE